jgi:putative hydrolase of the HAD superfamily
MSVEPTRAVLFDLDGTLLDRDTSLKLFLGGQYERFAKSLAALGRAEYIGTVVALDGFGHVSKPLVYAQLRERFGLAEDLVRGLLDDFETHFHSLAVPFPMMHETLQELRSRKVALGLVTNGLIRSQRPKIEALGIAGYFGAILISEEQGVRKPEPEIYHRAMALLGSVRQTTWFVGDHPEADIEGAARVGLKTIWKRNDCWPAPEKADGVIQGLEEIPPLIRF